jgi:hypothetical protein
VVHESEFEECILAGCHALEQQAEQFSMAHWLWQFTLMPFEKIQQLSCG